MQRLYIYLHEYLIFNGKCRFEYVRSCFFNLFTYVLSYIWVDFMVYLPICFTNLLESVWGLGFFDPHPKGTDPEV